MGTVKVGVLLRQSFDLRWLGSIENESYRYRGVRTYVWMSNGMIGISSIT